MWSVIGVLSRLLWMGNEPARGHPVRLGQTEGGTAAKFSSKTQVYALVQIPESAGEELNVRKVDVGR
jgi:hypothetical protein